MKLNAWIAGSLVRIFPQSPVTKKKRLAVFAARGEQASFQIAYRVTDHLQAVHASVEALTPDLLSQQIRRVGFVPMPHHNTLVSASDLDGVGMIPGLVPDVLFPQASAQVGPDESNAFWITLRIPVDMKSGEYALSYKLAIKDGPTVEFTVDLTVADLQIQPRRQFPITHWFYADALCDWYKVEPWSEAFWPIFEKYVANYVGHGLDTLYVPVFTPPLDGVKRPTQLLGVKKSVTKGKTRYTFDWSNVKQWIATAKRLGIKKWEWTHLFSQWGVKYALRIYHRPDKASGETLLWPPETGATSDLYREFLSQFLPEFQKFILAEGLMEDSYFHLSDEPHGDEPLANYKAARELLRELAPWIKVMDALSDIRFGKEGLTDLPIPVVSTALEFKAAGIESWCYYCCWPRGTNLNRLMDTPLAKIRMNGWLFYRFGMLGFLHWGYNYWYKSQTTQLIDPFMVSDGGAWPGWAYGDTFCVYPGPVEVGPIDSIRWEVFAESLQDYALLQTAGILPDAKTLAELKSFGEFPWSEAWINKTRRKIILAAKGE